jgi:hypothetical protein
MSYEQPEDQTSIPIKMTGGADCPVFYANVGTVMSTPFDIQLLFGDLVQADSKELLAKATARIVMTPEHAALLLQALTMRIQQYVQIHGKLRRVGVGIEGPGASDVDTASVMDHFDQLVNAVRKREPIDQSEADETGQG